MAQGLALFDLLVKQGKRVVHVRRLLLVERRHAEWLVHRDILATRRPVTIVCVVSETALVQIAKMRHDCVDATKETFIFLNDEQLVASAAESGDSFAQVLWQNLQCSICLLSADENLANYNKPPVNIGPEKSLMESRLTFGAALDHDFLFSLSKLTNLLKF